MTCPPYMEAAPKLNISYFVVQVYFNARHHQFNIILVYLSMHIPVLRTWSLTTSDFFFLFALLAARMVYSCSLLTAVVALSLSCNGITL